MENYTAGGKHLLAGSDCCRLGTLIEVLNCLSFYILSFVRPWRNLQDARHDHDHDPTTRHRREADRADDDPRPKLLRLEAEAPLRAVPPNAVAAQDGSADTHCSWHQQPPGLTGKRRSPRRTDLRCLIEQALDGARFSGIEVEDERTILASYSTLAGHLKCSKSTVHECLSRMSGCQVATFARFGRRTRITLLRRFGKFPAHVADLSCVGRNIWRGSVREGCSRRPKSLKLHRWRCPVRAGRTAYYTIAEQSLWR